MGKTYRRKDLKNDGYYDNSSARGEHSEEVSDAIFHSDKPERWSGISSQVKDRQREISRMEKRKIKDRVMHGGEPMYDKTDKTVKAKSNKNYSYS